MDLQYLHAQLAHARIAYSHAKAEAARLAEQLAEAQDQLRRIDKLIPHDGCGSTAHRFEAHINTLDTCPRKSARPE